MGLFTGLFSKASSLASSIEGATSYATWEREAHVTIPDLNLDNCSFEEYKQYQSANRLANSFSSPGECSSFLDEGKSYSEHLGECYEKDVLTRGLFKLW